MVTAYGLTVTFSEARDRRQRRLAAGSWGRAKLLGNQCTYYRSKAHAAAPRFADQQIVLFWLERYLSSVHGTSHVEIET